MRHALTGLLLSAMLVSGAYPADAGVQIQGTAKALRVDVEETPIADVLSALGPTFHVTYRSELPLDQEVDGSYRGSLRRVISRLLKDYNYFVKRDGRSIEIVIIEKQQAQPDPAVHRRLRHRRIRRRWNRRYDDE